MDLDKGSLKCIRYVFGMNILSKFLMLIAGILLEEKFDQFLLFSSYELAFSHIMILSSFLADGLVLSNINIYRKIEEEKGREEVFYHLNNLLNIVMMIGISTFILFIFFIKFNFIIFKDFHYGNFLLLGIPMVSLGVIRVIFTGFLQMMHGFYAGSRGNVIRGFLYIIYLLSIGDEYGLEGIMIFGNIIMVIQVIIAYRGVIAHGYEYDLFIDFKEDNLKITFMGMLFSILIFLFYELSIDDRHDNRFIGLFIGSVVTSIITVVYPILCEKYYRGDEGSSDFKEVYINTIGFLIKITIPILIIGLIGSDLINDLFIEDKSLEVNFFISHCIGLISLVLMPFLFRVMISYQDYKSPLIIALLSYIIGIILNRYMKGFINYLSMDISLFIGLILSLNSVDKKLEFLKDMRFKEYIKNGLYSSFILIILLLIFRLILSELFEARFVSKDIFYIFSIIMIIVYMIIYDKREELSEKIS